MASCTLAARAVRGDVATIRAKNLGQVNLCGARAIIGWRRRLVFGGRFLSGCYGSNSGSGRCQLYQFLPSDELLAHVFSRTFRIEFMIANLSFSRVVESINHHIRGQCS